MQLNTYLLEGATVVEVIGRIDTYSEKVLREGLLNICATAPTNLVIDLDGVNFIDSSGLAALVHGLRACRATGGNLCLASPQRPVRMILELTRLDTAIDIFPTTAEACSSLAQLC